MGCVVPVGVCVLVLLPAQSSLAISDLISSFLPACLTVYRSALSEINLAKCVLCGRVVEEEEEDRAPRREQGERALLLSLRSTSESIMLVYRKGGKWAGHDTCSTTGSIAYVCRYIQ